MELKEKIKDLFNKGVYKLDSKLVPLPESLEIHPIVEDNKCVLIFKVGVELRGDLSKQILSSFTDMRDFIDMYIEYLKVHGD